jgi:hypothetical protein
MDKIWVGQAGEKSRGKTKGRMVYPQNDEVRKWLLRWAKLLLPSQRWVLLPNALTVLLKKARPKEGMMANGGMAKMKSGGAC